MKIIKKSIEKINIEIYYASKEEIAQDKVSFAIEEVPKKILAYHITDYWNIPEHLDSLSEIKEKTQFMITNSEEGIKKAYLPVCHYDNYTTFRYEDELLLDFSGTLDGQEQDDTIVLMTATGKSVYEIVDILFKTARKELDTFKLRNEKEMPEFLNYLGWCTWDAFYHSVDIDKIKDGLESFKQEGIKLGFMILDDGALDTTNDYLNSFRSHPEKFKGGFIEASKMAKEEYGLKMFGLWHAFQGYWTGLNPEGELAEKYGIIENTNIIRPWIDPPQYERLCLVKPEASGRFFDDFYKELSDNGVDMVKADGQTATHLFTDGVAGRVSTMNYLQKGIQNAAIKHFNGPNYIACMSNGNDVMFNFSKANVWRNSFDYFPERPVDIQAIHIYCNAYNSIFTSQFAWPDWDMFQTGTPEAMYHAVSRALSGGPLYVCDKPWTHNKDILDALSYDNGLIPRFDRPAKLTEDMVFEDGLNGGCGLKISNIKGNIGTIGVFNTNKKGEDIKTTVSPRDVLEFALAEDVDKFAMYDILEKKLYVVNANEKIDVEIKQLEAKAFVVSPVMYGIAPLGMVSKIAAAATIKDVVYDPNIKISVEANGEYVFYCEKLPSKVCVDGKEVEYSILEDSMIAVKHDMDVSKDIELYF